MSGERQVNLNLSLTLLDVKLVFLHFQRRMKLVEIKSFIPSNILLDQICTDFNIELDMFGGWVIFHIL